MTSNQLFQELYSAFAEYSFNGNIKGSPQYDPKDIELWNKVLSAKPLNELSADDLSLFCGKAITTFGTIEDYKYFLPRILELDYNFNPPYELWIDLKKLDGIRETLNENQKHKIKLYYQLLFTKLIETTPEINEANFEDYFVSLWNFYDTPKEFVDIWSTNHSKNATLNIIELIVLQGNNIFHKGTLNCFEKSERHIADLTEFLSSSETNERILQFIDSATEVELYKTEWALSILKETELNRPRLE